MEKQQSGEWSQLSMEEPDGLDTQIIRDSEISEQELEELREKLEKVYHVCRVF